MFKELKEMLLNNVDVIRDLLESYGFEGVDIKPREIRFKRDSEGGMNISIKLNDNPSIIVHDFARNFSTDIFAYIVKEKECTLKDVLNKTKLLLGLESDWKPKEKILLFGGFYDHLNNRDILNDFMPEYPPSALNDYDEVYSIRFKQDGISYATQKFFGIRFDFDSNRIVIPLYDELGRLVGVKGRINETNFPDEVPKYLYLKRCMSSQYLYGYFQNYSYLFNNTVVIGESEKMVMQAHSMGVRNVVGLGSNSLSDKQAALIWQLNPERVIFALDEGLDISSTYKNIDTLLNNKPLYNNINIYYWDYEQDIDLFDTKCSPTDRGLDKYNEIINTELKKFKEKVT